MKKKTVTKVLHVDKEVSDEFNDYCKRVGIRSSRDELVKMLEIAMKRKVKQ